MHGCHLDGVGAAVPSAISVVSSSFSPVQGVAIRSAVPLHGGVLIPKRLFLATLLDGSRPEPTAEITADGFFLVTANSSLVPQLSRIGVRVAALAGSSASWE